MVGTVKTKSSVSVCALFLSLTGIGLGGCDTMGGFARGVGGTPPMADRNRTDLYAAVPKEKMTTAPQQLAAEGLKAIDAKDYSKASELFNLALKTDITNSYLHFLNAFVYQMRGMNGESSLFPLAEQGYDMAVQFDNSNWLARYYSGLLAMKNRDFARAQTKLAEAALFAGDRPELLYDLAVASYYNKDPKVAAAALEGLRNTEIGRSDPQVLQASAIIAAALNDQEGARSYLETLRGAALGVDDLKQIEGRVDSWRRAYQRAGGLIKTQFPSAAGSPFPAQGGSPFPAQGGSPFPAQGGSPFPAQGGSPFPAQGGSPFAGAGAAGQMDGAGMVGRGFAEKNMAVVDVVIISTEEDNTHVMGVNLLDGLRLQFGNPTTSTAGYSVQTNRSTDIIKSSNSTGTNVVTRLIQIPALTYSLNIANANGKRDEVLARPTLVALGNQPSIFFSGQDIVGAAVSGGQGSAVQIQKEVGVKLTVTPEFLPDNLIKLNVIAERTFLAIPSTSVKFDFRLDTNKTQVNANVVMKFGETLILSGLSERDQSKDRDGVPVLQDIPLVQYLFSKQLTRDYYKSVLILLTPRRAQYTHRDDADVAAEREKMSPFESAVTEFEEQFKPWFKPTPNFAEITKALESGAVYREFRNGDIAMSWQRMHSHEDRLRSAIRFLYF